MKRCGAPTIFVEKQKRYSQGAEHRHINGRGNMERG
jgi:hypothetical protein